MQKYNRISLILSMSSENPVDLWNKIYNIEIFIIRLKLYLIIILNIKTY